MNEETIFSAAIQQKTPEERRAFLDGACGNDAELRARVEALLQAHDNPDTFLEKFSRPGSETVDQSPIVERPGAVIGPYKLREEVGQGGMGVVFVAEQHIPIRRKVALKIIKPGMDTREVIARFEAERQALALMDHPNIAKVLDAGTTETGRPYFIMELVRGIPITQYCDHNRLTVRERLALFIQVCYAVQHAHQKGIIHRDLKPSNVLITLHDGKPVPKVIDFGVAKATNQRLTERTVYTRLTQIIGTPMYMSPEQAELSGLDVDTRSDVYSLGVLLYELLTGTTPIDQYRLQCAAFDELRRIIQQEEPLRPSSKVSLLGETATAVSAQRKTDPRGLERLVRGDLDWIVMKSLEKDRTRRYDTASSFAGDVERFVNNEPIDARPPSASYRMLKFVRRNRAGATMLLAVAVGVVVGFVGITAGLIEAKKSVARTEQVAAELARTLDRLRQLLIDKGLLAAMSGDQNTTAEAIRELDTAGAFGPWADILRGLAAAYSGKTKEAVSRLRSAAMRNDDDATVWGLLGWASTAAGDLDGFAKALFHLRELDLQDDYDRLFVAYVKLQGGDERELRAVAEVAERRPTWALGQVIYAECLTLQALNTDDLALVERSFDQLSSVRDTAGSLAITRAIELYTYTAAIVLGERHGVTNNEWRTEADAVASELENGYKDYVYGRLALGWYFTAINELERAEEQFLEAQRLGTGEFAQHFLDGVRVRLGKYDEVLCAGLLLKGKKDALERCSECTAANQPLVTRIWSLYAQKVYGQPDEAKREWKAILDSPEPKPWWIELALKSFLDILPPDELLAAAKGSYDKEALAHFCIAFDCLAKDDRPGAEFHFKECAKRDVVTSEVPQFARAYLHRIGTDSTWPDFAQVDPAKQISDGTAGYLTNTVVSGGRDEKLAPLKDFFTRLGP